MNRGLKLVFVVSLLLNLLLAGIVLGQAGHHMMKGDSFEQRIAALPETDQKHLRETLRLIEQGVWDMRSRMDTHRQKAAALLVAEPFDAAAYKSEVNALAQSRNDMAKRLGDTIASRAAEASPAERALLAEKMRRPPSRKPGR
jgi:uncharacterized membrane protein